MGAPEPLGRISRFLSVASFLQQFEALNHIGFEIQIWHAMKAGPMKWRYINLW